MLFFAVGLPHVDPGVGITGPFHFWPDTIQGNRFSFYFSLIMSLHLLCLSDFIMPLPSDSVDR